MLLHPRFFCEVLIEGFTAHRSARFLCLWRALMDKHVGHLYNLRHVEVSRLQLTSVFMKMYTYYNIKSRVCVLQQESAVKEGKRWTVVEWIGIKQTIFSVCIYINVFIFRLPYLYWHETISWTDGQRDRSLTMQTFGPMLPSRGWKGNYERKSLVNQAHF